MVLFVLMVNKDPRVPGWLDEAARRDVFPSPMPNRLTARTFSDVAAAALAGNPQSASQALTLAGIHDPRAEVRIRYLLGAGFFDDLPIAQPIEEAVIALLNDLEPTVASAAAKTCNRRSLLRALPSLIRLLDSPDPLRRLAGTDGCGPNLVDPTVKSKLVSLLDDHDERVRVGAVNALGMYAVKSETDDAESCAPLIKMMHDKVAIVRMAAIAQLGGFTNQDASDALVGALDDSDPQVRQHVLTQINRTQRVMTDAQRERVRVVGADQRTTTP